MDNTELTTTTKPDVAGVSARVRTIMADENKTMKELSQESGVIYGTFTSVLGGTYAGRVDDQLAKIVTWLEARTAKGRMQALMPAAPGFVETPTAKLFLATLQHAQWMPDFCVITGSPGTGKTTAIRQYKTVNPNVWAITAEPCGASPSSLLEELGGAMNLSGAGASPARLSREIARRLRGTNGLVVVDEAQNLEPKALDQLRTLFDLAEIGVALAGNETVYGRLEGGNRSQHFAQLFSRVGMRAKRLRPELGDIAALLDAWGVAESGLRSMLQVIGLKPGGLRGMTKVLRLAHMLASGERDGECQLARHHVEAAWARLSGDADLRPRAQAEAIRTERRRSVRAVGDAA